MAAGSMVVLETPGTQSLMPGRLNGCLGDASHSVIDARSRLLMQHTHCTERFDLKTSSLPQIIKNFSAATGVPPPKQCAMKPNLSQQAFILFPSNGVGCHAMDDGLETKAG